MTMNNNQVSPALGTPPVNDHEHEWVVFSTAWTEGWLMLQCVECGLHGTVEDPSDEEWSAASYAFDAPYRWLDESRVTPKWVGPLYVMKRREQSSANAANTKFDKQYVYKSTLSKVYGLTPSMIEELGPPDTVIENPYYPSVREANLYLIARVEDWISENKERVEKARVSRAKRSASAKKYHEKVRADKRSLAYAWLDALEIRMEPLPDDLIEQASLHFTVGTNRDVETSKAVRAFVRHHLTNYDELRLLIDEREPWLRDELRERLRSRADAVVQQALHQWKLRTVENRSCDWTLAEMRAMLPSPFFPIGPIPSVDTVPLPSETQNPAMCVT